MTREEAIEKSNAQLRHYGNPTNFEGQDIINKIYDDFQRSTCENCKWFDRIGSCSNEESALFDQLTWDSFGCNKFEPKENR